MPNSKRYQRRWLHVRIHSSFGCFALALVLKFVTSSSRSPVLGFVNLIPPFCIQKVKCETSVFASLGIGKDADRLPSASTCFNTLKLPNFKKASSLREKLLYACQSGTGFELS